MPAVPHLCQKLVELVTVGRPRAGRALDPFPRLQRALELDEHRFALGQPWITLELDQLSSYHASEGIRRVFRGE